MAATDKTDNGDPESKILVREQALAWAPKDPTVLECFAGEGHMFHAVWHKAARHLGMDTRFHRSAGDPNGECWRGNNEVLLKRAMQVGPWDIIDLDAYANPWPLLRRVLKMSPARELVVTATCGIDRAIRNGASDFACAVAGYPFAYSGMLTRWYDDVIRWAIAWAQGGTDLQAVEARRRAGRHNPQMRYYAIRFGVSRQPRTRPPRSTT
jgi:hypothetical protein